jgi:UMF1 family MFS transporter
VVGSYVSGWIVDKWGGKESLVIFLLLMIASIVGLFMINSITGFFVVGGIAGLALSAVQAVSRGMVSILSPPNQSAEFYGFFAVAGRTSSFIGPTIYGFVAAQATYYFQAQGENASFLWFKILDGGSPFAEQLGQRVAIIPVLIFLIVGLIILFGVDEKQARIRKMDAGYSS